MTSGRTRSYCRAIVMADVDRKEAGLDETAVLALPHAGHGSDLAAPPCEIELKLRATPDALERLRKAPLVAHHAVNLGSARRLEAVYYDTPDRLLDRHGISLRIRRSGSRHIQTLKLSSSRSDPLSRQEWEAPLGTPQLDLSLLPLAEIGEPLAGLQPEALKPVFGSKVHRRLRKLRLDRALVEIAFDSGVIEAGDRRQALAEVELELKEGDASALYEFGLALLDLEALQVETQSKAARGYKLAFETSFEATKAEPVTLSEGDNVDAAIAKILSNGHRQLMANLAPATAGGAPEGVHQMRVSLRRLRTALSMIDREFAPPALAQIAEDAKQLARVLGSARNWDVFLSETLPTLEKAAIPELTVVRAREAAEPFRAQSYAALRDTLAAPAANRFFLSFGCALERASWRNGVASSAMGVLAEPSRSFARRVLARAHRKSMKRGRHFKHLPPEDRHRLRISLKKLRYTSEFFLPLYADDPAAGKYLKRLSKLQDLLGIANDAATTHELVTQLRGAHDAPDLHYALGALGGWQRCEQAGAAKELLKTWRKFEATAPFWA